MMCIGYAVGAAFPPEDEIGVLNINCQGFAMKREGSVAMKLKQIA